MVGAQISIRERERSGISNQNMGSVSRSLRFHILHAREGNRILVARKIKVAVCSFEVNHLPVSLRTVRRLSVTVYFQSPQARTTHQQHLAGQPLCPRQSASKLRMLCSEVCCEWQVLKSPSVNHCCIIACYVFKFSKLLSPDGNRL